jgi:hypothetical protein
MNPIMIEFLCGYGANLRASYGEVSRRSYGDKRWVRCAQACRREGLRGLPGGHCRHWARQVSAQAGSSWRTQDDPRAPARGETPCGCALASGQPRAGQGTLEAIRCQARRGSAEGNGAAHLAAQARSNERAERQALRGLRESLPAVCNAVRSPRPCDETVQHRPTDLASNSRHRGRDRKMRSRVRQLPRRADLGAIAGGVTP